MEAPLQHHDAFQLRIDVFRKMDFDQKHPSSIQKTLQEYSTAIEPVCQCKSTMAIVGDLGDSENSKNCAKSTEFFAKKLAGVMGPLPVFFC